MTFEITVMSLDFDSEDGIQTKQFESPQLRIGRERTCDLVLKGEGVANEHALLSVNFSGAEPVIEITDLGSSNGTMIDNRPIIPNSPQALKKNQRIMIGNYLIRPSIIAEFIDRLSDTKETNGDHTHAKFDQPESLNFGRIIPKQAVFDDDDGDDPVFDIVATSESAANDEFAMFDQFVGQANTAPASDEPLKPQRFDLPIEPDADYVNTADVNITSNNGDVQPEPDATSERSDANLNDSMFVAEGVVSIDNFALNLEAQRLFCIRMRVRHNGQPLQNVLFDAGQLGTAMSGVDGNCQLSGLLEGGKFNLEASLAGYKITGGPCSGILDRDQDLEFSAIKLSAIEGRIMHHGQPLAGVVVDGGQLGQVTTDADGYYCFKDVAEGTRFKLAINKTGFVFKKR